MLENERQSEAQIVTNDKSQVSPSFSSTYLQA